MLFITMVRLSLIPLAYLVEIFPFLKQPLVEAPLELFIKLMEWLS